MRGELSTGKEARRHPLDWYVEEGWEWAQIVDLIGLEVEILDRCTIWDPACGYGHSLSWLQGAGFTGELHGSDLVDNLASEDFDRIDQLAFSSQDFLDDKTLIPPSGNLSIWMNPPYSYDKKPWLELFCRQALALATHRVVVLAPLKWLSGGLHRGPFFRRDFPPQQILYFTQRPSMPPGDRIHLMGNRAYRGGAVDYVAVVWDVRHPTAPGETRSVWLPRLGERS